jgi:hypothetical protein
MPEIAPLRSGGGKGCCQEANNPHGNLDLQPVLSGDQVNREQVYLL